MAFRAHGKSRSGVNMVWSAIRSGMERKGIRSIGELAERAGITKATLTQTRMKNPRSFVLYELLQLDSLLEFTAAEWQEIRE